MKFSTKLLRWYYNNKRELPWRENKDPYKIWLSEIILQQTRVNQGIEYYKKFICKFSNIKLLAEENEDNILKMWEGLGYYSRARNIHKTAKIICKKNQGVFPSNYKNIIKLPGIGPYTAAAILSICFNKKYAVVDGNVLNIKKFPSGCSCMAADHHAATRTFLAVYGHSRPKAEMLSNMFRQVIFRWESLAANIAWEFGELRWFRED